MSEFLNEKQEEAFTFFQGQLDRLADDPLYKFKYVIVYDNKIAGVYDTFSNALTAAAKTYPQGDYIIQQIIRDSDIVNYLYPATVA
jgi:hypothetical protein